MIHTINKITFYLKIFLLLVAFSFTLYIAFIKMDFASSSILSVLPIFIPFLALLILFVFGLFLNWKGNTIYYNVSSVLALATIIIIAFRTIFDKNIIAYPAQIGLDFYNASEGKIKFLLYLMILGNICLLYYQKRKEQAMLKSGNFKKLNFKKTDKY